MSVFSLFDDRKAAKHAGFCRECRGTFEINAIRGGEYAVAADARNAAGEAAYQEEVIASTAR